MLPGLNLCFLCDSLDLASLSSSSSSAAQSPCVVLHLGLQRLVQLETNSPETKNNGEPKKKREEEATPKSERDISP